MAPTHPVLVALSVGGAKHGTLILDPDGAKIECSAAAFLWHEEDAQGNVIAPNEEFEYRLGTLAIYAGAVPDAAHPGQVLPVWAVAEDLDVTIATVDGTGSSTPLTTFTGEFPVHPEPGKPTRFLSPFEVTGATDDHLYEFWANYLVTTAGSVTSSGPYRAYNSFYLVDRFNNVTFGYSGTQTVSTSQNINVSFTSQLAGSSVPDVSYPGYETDVSWSNIGGAMPSGTYGLNLALNFTDAQYGSGTVTEPITLSFISGTHSALVSQQDYDLRFGVNDTGWPVTVPPAATGSALPTTNDAKNPDPTLQVVPKRLCFQIVTGTNVPYSGETYENPHNVYDALGNYVRTDTNQDPHLETSEPGRMKLSVVDGTNAAMTDIAFQVHNCPHYDHEGSPRQPTDMTNARACADTPAQSAGGVIASYSVNPAGSSRGYMGIELLRAPTNPGTYYIKIESLDQIYRIEQLPGLTVDPTPSGEFKGAFAFITVVGGEFLDDNFQRFPGGVVKVGQPTIVNLRYSNPSGPGPATATLTSTKQDDTVMQMGVSLSVTRVAESQAYIGTFTAVPERYTGTIPTDKPSIQVALGGGHLAANQATAAPQTGRVKSAQLVDGGLLASAPTAFPGKLVLKFMKRDGSALTPSPDADPTHAGSVQQTEIGSKSENYAERVWLEIQAVNPCELDAVSPCPPGQVEDTNAPVGIKESPNSRYTNQRFYDGLNGSTLLDDSGKIGGVTSGSFAAMVHGTVQIQLTAVADARILASSGTADPGLPYVATLQPLPSDTADPLMPAPGPSLPVNQWVDERTYERRRTDPSKSWGATDTKNLVRDWLEKKAWDTWTDTPDDGSGQLDAGCRVLTTIAESTGQPEAGAVLSSSPEKVTFNPLVEQLRHPLAPPHTFWEKFYYGFDEKDPPDGFAAIALHESRHSWQFTLTSRGGVDRDGDFLFAPGSIPAASAELLDAPNIAAPGGANGDGHFKGDGPGLTDTGDAVRTMREHEAMRFTLRDTFAEEVSCALSGFSIVSGDGQTSPASQPLPQPLVVKVVAKNTDSASGKVVDAARAGVTIKFSVISGTATISGGSDAYAMTDDTGQTAVVVTNGNSDSQIQARVLAPMAPQSDCSQFLAVSTLTFTAQVQ